MLNSSEILEQIMAELRQSLGEHFDQFAFPPPVFAAMQGEFLAYGAENQALEVRFPVLESWLNPYGSMQGGMIAAAIDNTIGPLSVLLAPPNVTRQLDLKYSRPVLPDAAYLIVRAELEEREGRWLTFKAEARDPQGQRLARAKALHWILEE
ncbi:MAG TPA: PaaI family thioesterase [Chloroflexi bacterium]|nr:PaaI family thioesterase [Chloroflexota bacterium]HBY07411.1 PaaI family thioesterase [Chloroflexota bacterium]